MAANAATFARLHGPHGRRLSSETPTAPFWATSCRSTENGKVLCLRHKRKEEGGLCRRDCGYGDDRSGRASGGAVPHLEEGEGTRETACGPDAVAHASNLRRVGNVTLGDARATLEAGVLGEERQRHDAGGAVAVLGDDQLCIHALLQPPRSRLDLALAVQ